MFRAGKPLRPGQVPNAADWNAVAQAMDMITDIPSAFGSDLTQTGDGMTQDHGTPGHWAKLTAVTSGLYAHVEVTPDGVVMPAGSGYYGTAAAAGAPAREVNGRVVPVDTVVWLEIDPYRNGWVFAWGGADAPELVPVDVVTGVTCVDGDLVLTYTTILAAEPEE